MKIINIMEPINFLKEFYPNGEARVTTFADGTLVICPHEPKKWFDTAVASAAKANGSVRILGNMPCKIEADDGN